MLCSFVVPHICYLTNEKYHFGQLPARAWSRKNSEVRIGQGEARCILQKQEKWKLKARLRPHRLAPFTPTPFHTKTYCSTYVMLLVIVSRFAMTITPEIAISHVLLLF